MTPVAKTGLHCGDEFWVWDGLGGEVTPVAKTGLHCGAADCAERALPVFEVTPVAKTGLHCGQGDDDDDGA